MRRALAAGLCGVVGFTGASAGAAEEPPQRSFTASTAGTPVALATGGWQDEADGSGRLQVDFAAGPGAAARTTFAATWVTAPVVLREAAEPQTVASALAMDHMGNNVTDTSMALRVEYRLRQVGGQWSAWTTVADDAYIRPARKPTFHAVGVRANTVIACECAYQAEFRVSGSKAGVDVSRLSVVAANGGQAD